MLSNKRYNKITGNTGEKQAVEYLKKLHYKILDVNYKNKIGEIDIIARHHNIIVFVEVKSRTSDYFGLPRESVTEYKAQKIRKIATAYLKSKELYNMPSRFDVIDILAGELTHIKDCF